MGRKDAYTFPKSEAPGIWAEAPGTNPSGNPEPSIMKILSGECIKASKVGYVRHESNVRDAQILNLTKKNDQKMAKIDAKFEGEALIQYLVILMYF